MVEFNNMGNRKSLGEVRRRSIDIIRFFGGGLVVDDQQLMLYPMQRQMHRRFFK
jgi:hypothetical protein